MGVFFEGAVSPIGMPSRNLLIRDNPNPELGFITYRLKNNDQILGYC